MTLFKNKYRIESNRHKNWDYSSPSGYFVTICTFERKCFFGEIINEKFLSSKIGMIVKEEWENIPQVFSNVSLDHYVIMPNHIHGILVILDKNSNISLGHLISQFKSKATKKILKSGNNIFRWQSNYYDRIIKNEKEFSDIRQYIDNNILKWDLDKYHQNN